MKLDIPDEYVPLVVTALEHYHAYTRAIQREDARNRRLPIGSSGGALRRLKSGNRAKVEPFLLKKRPDHARCAA